MIATPLVAAWYHGPDSCPIRASRKPVACIAAEALGNTSQHRKFSPLAGTKGHVRASSAGQAGFSSVPACVDQIAGTSRSIPGGSDSGITSGSSRLSPCRFPVTLRGHRAEGHPPASPP